MKKLAIVLAFCFTVVFSVESNAQCNGGSCRIKARDTYGEKIIRQRVVKRNGVAVNEQWTDAQGNIISTEESETTPDQAGVELEKTKEVIKQQAKRRVCTRNGCYWQSYNISEKTKTVIK